MVAVLHFNNCTYKPGAECLSFGATEGQGRRCYEHIEDWCYEHDEETGRRTNIVKPFIQDRPLKTHTKWLTGSMVEIVAGSENAVSGPHPSKGHADEIDLMERPVWNQSRGLVVSNKATGPLPQWMKNISDGMIPPQDIVTSTRNSTTGLMQELLDEVEADKKAGNVPQFDVKIWCIWECVAEVPHCRNAPTDMRKKRLRELGRDPEELCHCDRVTKGWHDDDTVRTLQDSCGKIGKVKPGHEYKGFRGRGWKPYIDLVQTFKRNPPGTWLLQHECRTGRDDNLYITRWSLPEFGLRHYEPNPIYGPIYMGIDWGADNPASVLWFQYLNSEIPALDFDYQPIFLAAGGYVLFKEIYISNISSETLAQRVVEIENAYRAKYGHAWEVKGRFADPQGKGDRISFSNYGLKTVWPVRSRDKERMISVVQNLVTDDKFSVDVDGAPSFCLEVEKWGKNPRTGKEIHKHNHAMSAWRYGISNAEAIEGKDRAAQDQIPRKRDGQSKRVRKASTFTLGSDHVNYGGIAANGKTAVPMSKQFSLNVR